MAKQESIEPCKKEACYIQACLSKNNFLPQKYVFFFRLINLYISCLVAEKTEETSNNISECSFQFFHEMKIWFHCRISLSNFCLFLYLSFWSGLFVHTWIVIFSWLGVFFFISNVCFGFFLHIYIYIFWFGFFKFIHLIWFHCCISSTQVGW